MNPLKLMLGAVFVGMGTKKDNSYIVRCTSIFQPQAHYLK